MIASELVQRDEEVLGGTPVFSGTRVPVRTLLEYLEAGQTIDAFLDDFPTVERAQVTGVLAMFRQDLLRQPV